MSRRGDCFDTMLAVFEADKGKVVEIDDGVLDGKLMRTTMPKD